MDKLKDFIADNRQAFEDLSLPEGHEERFREKLSRRKTRSIRRRAIWLAVAASIVGFLFVFHTQWGKETGSDVCELSMEINEVRMYYNMQLMATVTKMEMLYKQDQSPGNLELLKQTQDVITSNLDFENRILPSLPCREETLFAMNQHYDASLAGMNILLDRMREQTETNRNN